MKKDIAISLIFALIILTSCSDEEARIDASGSFETVEILVSAEASGKIEVFSVQEGDSVTEGQILGQIDSYQTELKREQLLSSLEGLKSRIVDVKVQTAPLSQQVETLKKEKGRIENLLKSDAVNTKQLDDINAQLAMAEKQLYAQKVSLNNANRGISNEIDALISQIAQLDDQIEKAAITSPVSGSVLVKYSEKGEIYSKRETPVQGGRPGADVSEGLYYFRPAQQIKNRSVCNSPFRLRG